jgi:hypothetical protein
MLRRLMRRLIRGMERRYRYDAAYLHEILDCSPGAMAKLLLAQGMSLHRQGLPLEPWHVARIVATRHEDCGPCTQLCVDVALADGLEPDLLRAVLARDYAALPADALLAARLTEAVLAHAPSDGLRAEAAERFGQKGLISLAYAIAFVRVYPTLKRVLGHADACERIVIGGQPLTPARAA